MHLLAVSKIHIYSFCHGRWEYEGTTQQTPEHEAYPARASRRSVDLGAFSQWRSYPGASAPVRVGGSTVPQFQAPQPERVGGQFQAPQNAQEASQPSNFDGPSPACPRVTTQIAAMWVPAPHAEKHAHAEAMRRLSMHCERVASSGSLFAEFQNGGRSATGLAQEKQAEPAISNRGLGGQEGDLLWSRTAPGSRSGEINCTRTANQR